MRFTQVLCRLQGRGSTLAFRIQISEVPGNMFINNVIIDNRNIISRNRKARRRAKYRTNSIRRLSRVFPGSGLHLTWEILTYPFTWILEAVYFAYVTFWPVISRTPPFQRSYGSHPTRIIGPVRFETAMIRRIRLLGTKLTSGKMKNNPTSERNVSITICKRSRTTDPAKVLTLSKESALWYRPPTSAGDNTT